MLKSIAVVAQLLFAPLLFAPSLLAAPAPAPAAPTTSPSDALLTEAAQSLKAGKLADYAKSADAKLQPLLSNLENVDRSQLVRIVALRQLSSFVSRIEKPDDATNQTIAWLLEHPRVLDTLMLAVSEQDAPDRVLAVLSSLRSAGGKQLDEFPDLVAALCVVWDAPLKLADNENVRAETEQPAWLFRYYTSSRKKLRFDPQTLPWELAVYVVDNVVSQEEVAWAVQRYAGRGAIGSCYFDVPYDYSVLAHGTHKLIDGTAYTLMNLARVGGICGDQAYFASNVARSLGVPACAAVGLGGAMEGTAHAWVGFLENKGGRATWNFSEGRYPELQYWRGAVQDPRTRDGITDSDVALLAELLNSAAQDRALSSALCKACDLVEPARRADLLVRAIDLSPGNRTAWATLAELGAHRKLTDAQMTQATQVVAKFAAKPYPDFAFAMIKTLSSGRGTEQQMRALRDARGLFPQRPDIQAAIRLTEGDLLKDQKKPAPALAAYTEVLQRYNNAGPIVLEALERVDALLREHNELRRLADIYRDAWQRFPQPTRGGYIRSTPYYLVAERYMNVLNEIGNTAEAERVKQRLDALIVGSRRR
jgi:hypothetical protein